MCALQVLQFDLMRWLLTLLLVVGFLGHTVAVQAKENDSMSNETKTKVAADTDAKNLTVELKQLDAMQYVGFTVRTGMKEESDPSTAKIPALWQNFYGKNAMSLIQNQVSPPKVLGVYNDYESDYTGKYSLSAACQVVDQQDPKSLPEGMTQGTIPAQTYMIFTGVGPQPASIVKTWMAVWNYFKDGKSEYKRAYTSDFELYKSHDEVQIYIAVKKQ